MAVIDWWGGENRVARALMATQETMLTSPMVVRNSSTLTSMRWSDHVGNRDATEGAEDVEGI
jgi:hypothetical protein